MTVLLPLLLAFIAVPAVLAGGRLRPALAAPLAIFATLLATGALFYSWTREATEITLRWVPTLAMQLAFRLDALALLYGMIATGIGFLIALYSAAYLPHHLHEQNRPLADQIPYYGWLILFMAAMLGLVMANDLILLFLFFDLTAICSYFLIAFDRHHPPAQSAALTALLVTGGTSIAFLVGALMLYGEYGTFFLPDLMQQARPGPLLTTAMALIAVAALAKSAQVPLHFWLPQAMAAPTPISAYLHSAAMVAAGVFILHRLHPLLEATPMVRTALLGCALLSIGTGGILALVAKDLKAILAYSTIAQYGYIGLLLALGGAQAAAAAAFYLVVHAVSKSALFMVAGTVTTVTGKRALPELGGLAKRMPVLAIAGGVATAALAGLPLTAGFFKDELFFQLAEKQEAWLRYAAVVAAALTLTYTWRFWSGIFLGARKPESTPAPAGLVMPVVVLAVLVLLGGISAAPLLKLANLVAQTLHQTEVNLAVGYHFDLRNVNLMTLAAYAGAVLLILTQRLWHNAVLKVVDSSAWLGPERLYDVSLKNLNRLSHWLHELEVRDLRDRIASVLIPAGMLVGAALLISPAHQYLAVIEFGDAELPLVLTLLLAAMASVLTILQRTYLGLILTLTGVGISLALVFALLGAPDVALVAVLVETALTLLFLAALALLPPHKPNCDAQSERPLSYTTWWHIGAGLATAGLFFVVAWTVLTEPTAESIGERYSQLSPQAHADNIVAAIIADFRGLDTLGEITVIAIALLSIVTFVQGVRKS